MTGNAFDVQYRFPKRKGFTLCQVRYEIALDVSGVVMHIGAFLVEKSGYAIRRRILIPTTGYIVSVNFNADISKTFKVTDQKIRVFEFLGFETDDYFVKTPCRTRQK